MLLVLCFLGFWLVLNIESPWGFRRLMNTKGNSSRFSSIGCVFLSVTMRSLMLSAGHRLEVPTLCLGHLYTW